MTMYSSKHQWTSLLHGQSIHNEFGRLVRVMRRLAGSLRPERRWTIERGFFPFAVVSGCVIFLLGLSLPIGVAVGMLYTSIVLMGLWSPQRYAALWVAGGGTALLVLGFAFSTVDGSTVQVMIDRTFSLMTLWIVAVVSHLYHRHDGDREHLVHASAVGLAQVKPLQGVVLICISCKKIYDEQNRRHGVETHLEANSDTVLHRVLCPDCQRMRPATQSAS